MRYRLKAFGLHLLCSVSFLTLVLGGLYLGWYRWPGWYLAGALSIALLLVGVDVVLGPLLTLIVASPKKPRRVLARDIGVIVAVQLIAAGYGVMTLWNGRPLYYTYSEGWLEMVQAQELDAEEVDLGRKLNPALAPHWYSLPRWIYAPLPKDKNAAEQIMSSAVFGGKDVTRMPRYYRPWPEGLPDLRKRLSPLNTTKGLYKKDRQTAALRMQALGFSPDKPEILPMLGRNKPLLALIDPATTQIAALIRVD